MATMYDSGYGGDMGRGGYGGGGGYDSLEGERRKGGEQQQAQQQQSPYQQQNERVQQAYNQARTQSAQPQGQQGGEQQFQPQQDQRTFAQRQQAGEARPAPPQAQNQQAQQQFQQFQQLPPAQDPLAQQFQQMPPMSQQQQLEQQLQNRLQQPQSQQFQPVQMQQAQQQPAGIDPVAAAADPQGYAQWLQRAQAQEAQRPGSTMLGQGANDMMPVPGTMPFSQAGGGPEAGNFGPIRQATADTMPMSGTMAPNGFSPLTGQQFSPSGQPINPKTNRGIPAPEATVLGAGGPFTGDLGAFAASQLNGVGQGQGPLPTPYQADPSLAANVNRLAGAGLPDIPQYQMDPRLMQQAQQLTTGGSIPGVSAAGVNPTAAMGAGSPAGGGSPEEPTGTALQGAGGGGGGAASPAASATGSAATPAGGARGSYDRLLQEAYDTPSGFDNAAVKQLYDRMGQNIDDQFSQQQTALREEMAARGLSDSSIMGGRLSDLNVGQRQARTELANQLGIQRAQDYANQRNAVLGLGQAQQGQNLQAELGRGNLSLANQRLGLDAQGQRFGQQMQGLQFQNQLGQQGFQNNLASAQFGLQRAGQAFNQGLQGAQFQNMLGQQGFGNQMDVANLQRGIGNDRYNQSMGWYNALNNYGQQAFDNDMRTADFNARQQDSGWRRFMDSIVLGG